MVLIWLRLRLSLGLLISFIGMTNSVQNGRHHWIETLLAVTDGLEQLLQKDWGNQSCDADNLAAVWEAFLGVDWELQGLVWSATEWANLGPDAFEIVLNFLFLQTVDAGIFKMTIKVGEESVCRLHFCTFSVKRLVQGKVCGNAWVVFYSW